MANDVITRPAGRTPSPPPGRPKARLTGSPLALGSKIVLLGATIGLAVLGTGGLARGHHWIALVIMWLAVAGIVFAYVTPRAIPLKYLLPGTILLFVFVLYPVVYLVNASFTNYGDGHRGSKQETIDALVRNSVVEVPGSTRYRLSVATKGDPASGDFVYFLTDETSGTVYLGDAKGLTEVDKATVKQSDTGKVLSADGYTIFTGKQINTRSKDLAAFSVPTDAGAIKAQGLSEAYEGKPGIVYDAAADTLTQTDPDTGATTVYTVKKQGGDSFFFSPDGKRLGDQGWKEYVGISNYKEVLSDPIIRKGFLGILAWNIGFAVISVLGTFAIGLLLAIVLNDPRVRGRRLYRSLLLLPYAIPAFLSLLVWQSMYNKDYGLINSLFGTHIDWLNGQWSAKFAVLLTNLWLGFPYMFIVCTGALQAIPSDVSEAASVDGAGKLTEFRRVTLPLLLISTAPLLVASFAFNFNNYGAIRLLTNGAPFPPDNPSAGGTDILISYVYRIAFGGSGARFGFAAAVSVLLFVLVAVMATAQFRMTRRLEDA